MSRRFFSILAAIVLLATASCGTESDPSSRGSGELEVSLTDAPSPDYQAVYVSVNQVEVKASAEENGNGWQVIDVVNKTINLLDLTGGFLESLGKRDLPAGDYNQLRLLLATSPDGEENILGEPHPHANYVIETDGTVRELKVPSGYQSGIKLVKGFTIVASELTELILDFDAMKSVVKAGSSGKWLLKPVIEVIDTVTVAGIGGSVTAGSNAEAAAWVAAQTYAPSAADPKDQIRVHAATLTDTSGSYFLRVLEGDYTLVAFKKEFLPQCRFVTTTTGTTQTEEIALTTATPGTLNGTLAVTVSGLTATDDSVTVSVRRQGFCGGTVPTLYEVTSQSFAEDGDYNISLPPGNYTVVAYGENLSPTLSTTKSIESGKTQTMTVAL